MKYPQELVCTSERQHPCGWPRNGRDSKQTGHRQKRPSIDDLQDSLKKVKLSTNGRCVAELRLLRDLAFANSIWETIHCGVWSVRAARIVRRSNLEFSIFYKQQPHVSLVFPKLYPHTPPTIYGREWVIASAPSTTTSKNVWTQWSPVLRLSDIVDWVIGRLQEEENEQTIQPQCETMVDSMERRVDSMECHDADAACEKKPPPPSETFLSPGRFNLGFTVDRKHDPMEQDEDEEDGLLDL